VADDVLTLWVLDCGPGFSGVIDADGLGLAGLKDRVESLGGQMEIANRTDRPGTELRMSLDLRGAV
jgi:signal transduction histidine kinase